MKILVVSHTYVTKMSQDKIQALTKYFGDVGLAVPFQVKDTLRTINYEDYPGAKFKVFKLSTRFDWHNSLRLYSDKEVENVLSSFRPDLVLMEQEPYSLSTYQWLNKKKAYGFKVLLFSFQNIHKIYPIPFRWVERRNLKLTDVFVSGCDSVAPVWIKKGFPPEKMEVLPQVGIDEKIFSPALNRETAKEQIGFHSYSVVYAGRFVEEKGLILLIRAFAASRLPIDSQLVFAGRGPLKEKMLEEIKRKNIENRVMWIEGMKHDEMSRVFSAADVLVLPSLITASWREQFGHVLIEAMASGCPCIGSDIDPINSVIGDGGLVFPMGSEIELKNCLEKMADQNLRRQYSVAGRNHVLKNFTNDIIAKKLFHISEKVTSWPRTG